MDALVSWVMLHSITGCTLHICCNFWSYLGKDSSEIIYKNTEFLMVFVCPLCKMKAWRRICLCVILYIIYLWNEHNLMTFGIWSFYQKCHLNFILIRICPGYVFNSYWIKNRSTIHQLFIDFKRAYDLVNKEVLLSILTEFGILI